MPTVMLKRSCGIGYKALLEQDSKTQLYACDCGAVLAFCGTVSKLWFTTKRSGRPLLDDWKEVSVAKVYDWL
jgi:hypothetical protein